MPFRVDTEVAPHEAAAIPADAPAYCAVGNAAILRRAALPDTPRWFFKPLPWGDWVAYASPAGNNLMDLASGRILPVPGNRDAVPTPDGRFLTSPGVYFTALGDLLAPRPVAEPLRLKVDLDGEYQSPGVLDESPLAVTYRLMIGRYEPAIRDLRVRLDGPAPRIDWLGETRRPCGNRQLQLPMLAPDGRAFGAYDVAARSTRLFLIRDDASCTLSDDLGMPTGKVSFSHDSRYVTFHLAVRDQASLAIAENPDDGWTSNVFVYDRHTKRIGRLTHNTIGNAWYPAFRRDGLIVFLFKPLEDSHGRYSFVVADPGRIDKWLPVDWYARPCAAGAGDCHRRLALGALRAYACSERAFDTNARLAALHTLSLDRDTCRALVNAEWDERARFVAGALRELPDAQRLRELPRDRLLSACEALH